MVTKYGMSETLGPIAFGSSNDEVFLGKDYNHMRNYSESVAAEIDNEVEKIISTSYGRCEKILKEHIDKLQLLAKHLMEFEKIDGAEFKRLMTAQAAE
jgi:cell division protease FtsH